MTREPTRAPDREPLDAEPFGDEFLGDDPLGDPFSDDEPFGDEPFDAARRALGKCRATDRRGKYMFCDVKPHDDYGWAVARRADEAADRLALEALTREAADRASGLLAAATGFLVRRYSERTKSRRPPWSPGRLGAVFRPKPWTCRKHTHARVVFPVEEKGGAPFLSLIHI